MIRAFLLGSLLALASGCGDPFTAADPLSSIPTADAGDVRGARLAGEDAGDPVAADDAAAGDALAAADVEQLVDDAGVVRLEDARPVDPPGPPDAGDVAGDAGTGPRACMGGSASCPTCKNGGASCCTAANLCGCSLFGAVCR